MKNSYSYCLRALFFPLVLTISLLMTGCASQTKPDISKNIVSAWSSEAVLTIFNYDYAHSTQQLHKASHYFTTQGWKNYKIALKSSGNLQTVINKKMIASAVLQGNSHVLGSVRKNQDAWKVKLPILLSYQNAHTNLKQSVIITLVILRTHGQIGVRGLAIDQLLVQSAIKEK